MKETGVRGRSKLSRRNREESEGELSRYRVFGDKLSESCTKDGFYPVAVKVGARQFSRQGWKQRTDLICAKGFGHKRQI